MLKYFTIKNKIILTGIEYKIFAKKVSLNPYLGD
jgi:hypothetical protein